MIKVKKAKLVKKAKKGDNKAFVQLIKQYELVLYRTAKGFRLNENDIADVIQDTVMTAFEKINTLKNDDYFNTWLYRILIHNCSRHLKRLKKVIPLDIEKLNNLSSKDESDLEFYEALETLDDNHRIVLTLYYVNDLTIKEISQCLNEPEGTIKSRISRARQKLKDTYYSNLKGEFGNA